MHQISSGATWNRKENLKPHIFMYSIGGWTGRANIHWSAHAIGKLLEDGMKNKGTSKAEN